MKTIVNLFLMDISHASNTSGVDRYMGTLMDGLRDFANIHVHWIHFTDDRFLLYPKEEIIGHYIKFSIPLPQYYDMILTERFWNKKYDEQVYRLTKHLFEGKENVIIHLHTLNLIDLAVYIRELEKCKIITHLHCIPWKGLYNKDKRRFNKLYELTYSNAGDEGNLEPQMYVTNNCELLSYSEPDALICVTNCAVDFLKNCIHNYSNSVMVIPNGMYDFNRCPSKRTRKKPQDPFHCLYVGILIESKGILYILKALQTVQRQGYDVSLSVAGTYSPSFCEKLKNDYPDLKIDVKGLIPFEELKKLYAECDMGIIASLQEQASYVAIEMAMFGLPIVTTAVDGLDEMFTDGVNALKVNTVFSPVFGLSVDVEEMVRQIIRLINDNKLRDSLSRNVRKLYEEKLNLELMINRTVDVYERITHTTVS